MCFRSGFRSLELVSSAAALKSLILDSIPISYRCPRSPEDREWFAPCTTRHFFQHGTNALRNWKRPKRRSLVSTPAANEFAYIGAVPSETTAATSVRAAIADS
jgi:hypothetical protein